MTKKIKPSMPFKHNPETVLAIQSLQSIAGDDSSWAADENVQLQKLTATANRVNQLQAKASYCSIAPPRTH